MVILIPVDLILLRLSEAEVLLVDRHTLCSQPMELQREGVLAWNRGWAVKGQDKPYCDRQSELSAFR